MSNGIETMHTSLGDLLTIPVLDREIDEGTVFVGPDKQTVYLATADCDERGWLFVRDLCADQEAKQPDGTLVCEGFFAYSYPTVMHVVLGEA